MPDPTRAMIGGLQFRYLIGRVPLMSEDGTVSQHPGLDGQVYQNTGRRGGVQQLTGRAAFETAQARALFIIACASLRRCIVTLHDNDGLEWIGLFVVARRYLRRVDDSTERLRSAYDETLAGWAAALDIRDRSTAQHTERVTRRTVELARRFGFDGRALDDVRRGATLHDIGKMGVPDEILLKPGALDDAEWVQMRRHPELAVQFLQEIAYLQPALDIPWCHHEKWDGSGYPGGLAGEEIPLCGRIVALADVFDAISSHRVYKPAYPRERCWDIINAGRGAHFDPRLVAMDGDLDLTGGLDFGRGDRDRHQGGRATLRLLGGELGANLDCLRVAMVLDPAAQQVGIEPIGKRHRRDRDPRLQRRCNDLTFEFFRVPTTNLAPGRLHQISVHVST